MVMTKLVLVAAALSMVLAACGTSAEEQAAAELASAIEADFDLRLQQINDTDDWCEAVTVLEDVDAGLELVDPNSQVAVETAYNSALEVLVAADELTPAPSEPDMALTVEGFERLTAALEDADWIFTRADFLSDSLDPADVALSSYNISLYNFEECNVGTDPGDPPDVGNDQ